MNSKIVAIDYYIPKTKVTNTDLSNLFPEWDADKISSKTGIFERGICEENEFASDLALKAAQLLISNSKVDVNSIDFLLYCTQSPDYFLPTTACIIHRELSLSKNCGALDYNLGCSGFVYGLSLANGLIKSGSAKTILLITAETYSKFIHIKDKSNKTIFGDGAAATLICKTSKKGFMNFVFGTDGTGAKNLIVKTGGIRYRQISSNITYNNEEFIKSDDHLFMNGQEIFKFTTTEVPLIVNNCLNKNKLKITQIDLFIFHQANKYMLDFIKRKLNISDDDFFVFLKDTGNTVSSTIPIAMHEAIRVGKLKRGMKVMLVGFGVGYSSSAIIINY
jgi:3-oxoacyl-[acyl-carrier-protein] synthase-3